MIAEIPQGLRQVMPAWIVEIPLLRIFVGDSRGIYGKLEPGEVRGVKVAQILSIITRPGDSTSDEMLVN